MLLRKNQTTKIQSDQKPWKKIQIKSIQPCDNNPKEKTD